MSQAAINDYLTKQITVNKNIVTFRLLSRALSIHVNAAKEALAAYHKSANTAGPDASVHATYLLTGDEDPRPQQTESMEVDDQTGPLDALSPMAEVIVCQKVMVVPEEELEAAKATFKTLNAVHYYSLSPSSLRDPSVLVTAVDAVRKIDASHKPEDLSKLGVSISVSAKYNPNMKKPKPAAKAPLKPSISKSNSMVSDKSNVSASKPTAVKDEVKQEAKPTWMAKKDAEKSQAASKPSGKLDWGKAKGKGTDTKKPSQDTKAASSTVKADRGRASSVTSSSHSDAPPPKRGLKRASPPSNDEEEELSRPPKAKARLSAPAKAQAAEVRAKHGVLLSDDEDEVPTRSVRRKTTSGSVMSIDWSDDENVVQARQGPPSPQHSPLGDTDDDDEVATESEALGDEDVQMEGEDEPSYAKKERKQKKAWPVGTNGLRKERVVKQRMFQDARGFLQTEDYSEYESVQSASEEPPEPSKKKATAKATPKPTPTSSQQTSSKQPSKSFTKEASFSKKPTPKAAGGKKTLDSFFQKK